jgi:hypothetical protein
MVCWGLALVLVQIKPFWVDEWRVIYNLKYKSPALLFGPLDFMQQFPRVYLEIIKAFTSLFDYSYFTLRLPSFIVGSITIIFGYRLAKKIYPPENLNRFLLVMILVSSYTFTQYFVQMKQYTMDILLSLAALWQLVETLKLKNPERLNRRRYILLCSSFIIAPFFSYTYPVVIAPVFVIVIIQGIFFAKCYSGNAIKRVLLLQFIPLLFCAISIAVFYAIDVSQLMKDQGMHSYWAHLMMKEGFSWHSFFINLYQLFAQVGSGLLYSVMFGILGVVSFGYGIYKCIGAMVSREYNINELILFYSTGLLMLVIAKSVVLKIGKNNFCHTIHWRYRPYLHQIFLGNIRAGLHEKIEYLCINGKCHYPCTSKKDTYFHYPRSSLSL